jgi:histidinol-phosphatase (PHP family)
MFWILSVGAAALAEKPMIDAHVHIERGPYSESWIDVFVERAKIAGIDELHLLEHSFRFHEFKGIYDSIGKHSDAGDYQRNWLESKCCLSLGQYRRLIRALRGKRYPITVELGLEICHFPESEDAIREIVSDFEWACERQDVGSRSSGVFLYDLCADLLTPMGG